MYRCENERLRAGETAALTSMRQNAQVASKYLIKAAQDAEMSIKYVKKNLSDVTDTDQSVLIDML